MDDKEKERLILVEKQTEINTKKIDDHERDIKELRKTYSLMETMALRIGSVEENVKSINNKLDSQSNRITEESNKGNKIKAEWFDYLLKGILTLILGYIAVKIGLK